jgi:ElaB/YqjD/DUF883 family membrane-anchored ribosome-binding protein
METIFRDLQQVVDDLEKLLAASTGEARGHAEQAVKDWRSALKSAQGRVEKLQEHTRRRVADSARTASQALRDNPWKSMGIVAAAGFLLGFALRGHDQSKPEPQPRDDLTG